MATRKRCQCGKVISRYATRCASCDRVHYTRLREEALAKIASGLCPKCGGKIRANLSITGWYQCEQLGAETHRKDPSKPSCDFQVMVPEVR